MIDTNQNLFTEQRNLIENVYIVMVVGFPRKLNIRHVFNLLQKYGPKRLLNGVLVIPG